MDLLFAFTSAKRCLYGSLVQLLMGNIMVSLTKQATPSIGQALRERRGYHGWTLADVSEKTGVSKSALSKIENDLISPSYQTILQLCAGLGIEIGDLMSRPPAGQTDSRPLTGRRSISHAHEGLSLSDDQFSYTYLCTDIAHKRIIPMVIEVKANSLSDIEGLWNHVGEEFLYVLEGSIELHTEFYEPTPLVAGDSAYFDSTMGHAYIATSEKPARLLVMCSSATPNLAQVLREVLTERLSKRDAHRAGMKSPVKS
ncbi:XRE family transcriptional regulator [Phyllobacterium sp. SB3]|uniref:helix-turn-helix domain-containing protein n=1 Tax=Phyllobacterium sp. SB3 TaxID=3156073 RepID=UPI0032AF8FA5